MNFIIRVAEERDMSQVLQRIQDLAVYEKEPDAVKIDERTLKQYGTGENPLFTCFVAEDDGDILGIALVYFRFSTWVGKSLHLEDLIVAQEHRGRGVGQALYNQVMRYGLEQNVSRVEWVVLDWNTDAIKFYQRNGATILTDWHLAQINEASLKEYVAQLDSN